MHAWHTSLNLVLQESTLRNQRPGPQTWNLELPRNIEAWRRNIRLSCHTTQLRCSATGYCTVFDAQSWAVCLPKIALSKWRYTQSNNRGTRVRFQQASCTRLYCGQYFRSSFTTMASLALSFTRRNLYKRANKQGSAVPIKALTSELHASHPISAADCGCYHLSCVPSETQPRCHGMRFYQKPPIGFYDTSDAVAARPALVMSHPIV